MSSSLPLRAKQILQVAKTGTSGVPLVDKVADLALKLAGLPGDSSADQKEWVDLTKHVGQVVGCVIGLLPGTSLTRDDLKQRMEELKSCLEGILSETDAVRGMAKGKRVLSYAKAPDRVVQLRTEFDQAVNLFNLTFTLTTAVDVAKVLERLDIEGLPTKLGDEIMSRITLRDTVRDLPYAEQASWEPANTCLPNTRTALLTQISSWIAEGDTTKAAEIFWLVDVAGSGKTAIAHTVSRAAHETGELVTAFFFDQTIDDRKTPKKLFSTIARDLAGLDKNVAAAIGKVMEEDFSLRTASCGRQFRGLILNPSISRHYPAGRRFVIVIDALDEGLGEEGCNEELLYILSTQIPKLPGNFRFFLTSRPDPDIVHALEQEKNPHIRKYQINLHGEVNQSDITLYSHHRLRIIGSKRRMKPDWPGSQLTEALIKKAEGLFLWASTVLDFLSILVNPDKQLRTILSARSPPSVAAKMDLLYTTILDACHWEEDEDFVDGYRRFMGTVVAAKDPLSCSAIQELHHGVETDPGGVFEQFGSLLTGFNSETEPVRVLHLSLREFITDRARSAQLSQRFHLDAHEHSQVLAQLCLEVINRALTPDIPCLRHLRHLSTEADFPQPPTILKCDIPEALYYACQFWTAHILDVDMPSQALIDALRDLLATRLVLWIEIVACLGPVQKLDAVRAWLDQRLIPNHPELKEYAYHSNVAGRLNDLSCRLTSVGRREDALNTIEEAVGLYLQLSQDRPKASNPDLAMSHNNLSNCLSHVGRREDALIAIEASLVLYRQLASDQPEVYNPGLAKSLNNRSNRLSDVGRREDALIAIKEAVRLYRQVAKARPQVFNPDLAMCLHNLSCHLSEAGRPDHALLAIQEAVELRRQLAKDRPQASNPDLAMSLNNLAIILSDVGRREEALIAIKDSVGLCRQLPRNLQEAITPALAASLTTLSNSFRDVGHPDDALMAIQEAVELRRQLAKTRPLVFNADLASSLHNLSNCLSEAGRPDGPDHALAAINEAVELRRQLAEDRPEVFDPDLASSLHNLSNRLFEVGRGDDALIAIETAVELRRKLARDHPEVFNPDLAASLNSLAVRLSDVARLDEALVANEEAAELYRQLAKRRPVVFNPDLGMSLNNLAGRLSNVGRREEALLAIEEAVELRRQLAKDRPRVFNSDLARSLNNLSNGLSDVGRQEDALIAIKDAVQINRQLAKDKPEVFSPVLAVSLNNLSKMLSHTGRREEALAVNEEAAELYRQLAKSRPAVFNPGLGLSLNNLAIRLSDVGRRKESLMAIEEAVQLRRQLAKDRPEVFNSDLAASLNNLSMSLSDVGRQGDALIAINEAVELRRQLAKDRPEVINADLAASLHNLSKRLSDVGRCEDALVDIEDAVGLYRSLAKNRPAIHTSALADGLVCMSNTLSALGRQEEALNAKKEADDLHYSRV